MENDKQKARNLLIGGVLGIILGVSFSLPIFILGGIGALIWSRQLTKKKKGLSAPASVPRFELTDDLIIRLAKRLDGRITAEDLSAQTSLTVEQAKARLESLQQRGVCDIDLDGISLNGKIYYQFD